MIGSVVPRSAHALASNGFCRAGGRRTHDSPKTPHRHRGAVLVPARSEVDVVHARNVAMSASSTIERATGMQGTSETQVNLPGITPGTSPVESARAEHPCPRYGGGQL